MDHDDGDGSPRGPLRHHPPVAPPAIGPVLPALREILRDAVRDVPGVDGAGVTRFCDDTGAPRLERLVGGWAGRDEGPCVDAMRERRSATIVIDDIAAEATARWPHYAHDAGRAGVRSIMTFVMSPSDAMPIAVSFYAARTAALTGPSRAFGNVFAMRAALAIYGAHLVGRLLETWETRESVGLATGILMERFGLDPRQAHAMLLSSAHDTGSSLPEVARWLVAQGKPPPA